MFFSSGVSRSKAVTMAVTVQQNPTTVNTGKKRAVGDLSEYVPGILDSTGREKVAIMVSVKIDCQ